MATNTYFSHNNVTDDTTLIRKLVQESIKIVGFNCWYLPRVEDNVDPIFQEAARVRYDNAYQVEMYVEDPVDALANSVDYVGQFGFEIRDSCDFTIAQQTFTDLSVSGRTVPKEGDLIYAPIFGQMYEIKFVEDMTPFIQAGTSHTYILMSRLFIYDDQEFNITTSDSDVNAAIEALETERSFTLPTTLGVFLRPDQMEIGEILYQGADLANATWKGEITKITKAPTLQGGVMSTQPTFVSSSYSTWQVDQYVIIHENAGFNVTATNPDDSSTTTISIDNYSTYHSAVSGTNKNCIFLLKIKTVDSGTITSFYPNGDSSISIPSEFVTYWESQTNISKVTGDYTETTLLETGSYGFINANAYLIGTGLDSDLFSQSGLAETGTVSATSSAITSVETPSFNFINVSGTPTVNKSIKTSDGHWVELLTIDEESIPNNLFAQNIEIETSADGGIVDFTETNPFGNF